MLLPLKNLTKNIVKKRAVGIDISDSYVKIAGLEKRGQNIQLLCVGKTKCSKEVVENGEIKNETALSQIVQQALQKLKGNAFKIKNVYLSLPEEKCFVDIIKIPLMPEEKIEQAVMLEAENIVPLPLNEIYFDFEKVQTTARLAKCQEILFSAVPQKIADSYLNVLQKANLTVQNIEPESLATARALTEKDFFYPPLLFVDLGITRTCLTIFAGKNIRFTWIVPISAAQLDKNIANFLNISLDNAQILRKKEGLTGKKEVFEAMVPLLTDLAEQIKHYVDYWQTHQDKCQYFDGKSRIPQIILCGQRATLKGLKEFLHSELKLKVEWGDPTVNLAKDKLPPSLQKENLLTYGAAIGLALKQIYAD